MVDGLEGTTDDSGRLKKNGNVGHRVTAIQGCAKCAESKVERHNCCVVAGGVLYGFTCKSDQGQAKSGAPARLDNAENA